MTPTAAEIGARLLKARTTAGLTQVQIAELVGVMQSTISRWELGAVTPNALQLNLYCTLVGADPGDILSEVAA